MGTRDNIRIITRKKIITPDLHGGAWKVAYADFVTAMMAFFLLLWLLNAVTRTQVVGVADYFKEAVEIDEVVIVSDSTGKEELSGDNSILTNPLDFDVTNPTVLELLEVPQDIDFGSTNLDSLKTLSKDEDNVDITDKELENSQNFDSGIPLMVVAADSHDDKQSTMLVESRRVGLNVNIAHIDGIFQKNTAILNTNGQRQLARVSTLLTSNYESVRLIIEGYTSRQKGVNLWRLSLERGRTVMEWLLNNRFQARRSHSDKKAIGSTGTILGIDGYADKQLLDADNPQSQINDRIILKFIDFDLINDAAQ